MMYGSASGESDVYKRQVVLNRETFDSDAFKNKGGYNAVNKAFGQKLDEFIDEINGYMYSA